MPNHIDPPSQSVAPPATKEDTAPRFLKKSNPRLQAAIDRLRKVSIPSAANYRYTCLRWRQFRVMLLAKSNCRCAICDADLDPDLDSYSPNFNAAAASDAGWLDGEEKPTEFYRAICHICHSKIGMEKSAKPVLPHDTPENIG